MMIETTVEHLTSNCSFLCAALRRSGSKNSLYASRSSLYNRRRRRGSVGSVYSAFAHDDMDYRDDQDFDNRSLRSLSRRSNRAHRSLGDLEHELRESATRSTQTLRECATQTGTGFANVTPGKKSVVKRTKPRSTSSSHTQTGAKSKNKDRQLDTSSSSSGMSKTRQRTNSTSSSGRPKSRQRKNSDASTSSRPRRAKSESELKTKLSEDEASFKKTKKPKPKLAPKPKPRKSVGHLSDDDMESVATGMTGPIDHSSAVGYNGGMGQAVMPPQGYYPYPPMAVNAMGHPIPVNAMGQPIMVPYGQPMPMGAVVPNPGLNANRPPVAPKTAPKPSKWDALVKMTDGEKAGGGDSASVVDNPYGVQHFPPAYASAVNSDFASERSGPRSAVSGASSRNPKKSSWAALKEMTDGEYLGSQSNV